MPSVPNSPPIKNVSKSEVLNTVTSAIATTIAGIQPTSILFKVVNIVTLSYHQPYGQSYY